MEHTRAHGERVTQGGASPSVYFKPGFGSSPSRMFLCQGIVNMLKGLGGLAGIIRRELGSDPMNGTFLFSIELGI